MLLLAVVLPLLVLSVWPHPGVVIAWALLAVAHNLIRHARDARVVGRRPGGTR